MRASFYVVVCSGCMAWEALMLAGLNADKETAHRSGPPRYRVTGQIPGLRSGQRPMISGGRSPLSCSSTTSNPHS